MSYSDTDLRQAVDAVFNTYDTDKSGTLEASEVKNLINDALRHMGQNKQITDEELKNFISTVDENNDGKIAKSELFEIFKKAIIGK